MPSKSQAQHNAMEAAAHGSGTIGIPASVAKEFVAADAKNHSYEARSRMPHTETKHAPPTKSKGKGKQ